MATLISRLRSCVLGTACLCASGACTADPPAASVSRVPTPAATQQTPGASSPGTTTTNQNPTTTNRIAGTGGSASVSNPPNKQPTDAGQKPVPAKDAGPMLPVMCSAADDGGMADDDAGTPPTGCLVVSDLHLQYRAADTNAGDNQIKPHFNIVNHGTRVIDLTQLTIRYWYTDTAEPADMAFACDYAQIGCGNVHNAFAKVTRQHASRYLELSFSGGSLDASGQTGEIQARFNRTNWTNFDESDDYSFDPTKSAFTDWYAVTLYRAGTLVWGAEPD